MDLELYLVVPAHDQRDLDFALKYKLKVKTVVLQTKDKDLKF